jgi:hypothetical protein
MFWRLQQMLQATANTLRLEVSVFPHVRAQQHAMVFILSL